MMNTAALNPMDSRIGVLVREGRTIYYATLSGRQVERRTLVGIQRALRGHNVNSLAQANGRGSAGKCPASGHAKTPAARVRVNRVAAALDGADTPARMTAAAAGEGIGA